MIKIQYPIHYKALEDILTDNIIAEKDKGFARSILKHREWTIRQAHAVYKLLNTHKDKLNVVLPEIKNTPCTEDPEWTASIVGNEIFLSFIINDKNTFFKIVDTIKELPGKKWNQIQKQWSTPLNLYNIKSIRNMGFVLSPELDEWYKKQTVVTEITKRKVHPVTLAKKIDLNDIMYPFQKEGLSYVEAHNGRTIIADEMGLGKTIQALSYLKLHLKLRPALVVVPASAKINWQRETLKWIGEEASILDGKKGQDELVQDKNKIYIINYDILPNTYTKIINKKGKKEKIEQKNTGWIDYLKKVKFKCVVSDESHKIKNKVSHRTKAFQVLCEGVPSIIMLTGTPIRNRPIELFTLINILRPDIFPNYYKFGHRYCDPKNNGFGIQFKGASNIEELHRLLNEYVMIRRTKAEVLPELPTIQNSIVLFELDEESRRMYNDAEDDVIQFIQEQQGKAAAERASRAEALAKFNQLKQITSKGKIKNVIEWIEDFLESDEKLIVFAVHKKVITALMEKFGDKAVKLDGSCSKKQRQESVDKFQTDDSIRLFIGNFEAAGEAITLTAASNMAIIEFPWTPGSLSQAVSRNHRIGQKNACTVYYLLAKNTLEETIASMIDTKTKVISSVIDGKEVSEDDLLTELINSYSKNKK